MFITLERFCYSDFGTFGDLIMPDGQVLKTVERPWIDNKKSISCIPVGTYDCVPRRYNRGGYDAVEVTQVKNRSYILFHKGNFAEDSAGCILVCAAHGVLKNRWAGLSSDLAFDEFMGYVRGKNFRLIIKNKNDQGYLR